MLYVFENGTRVQGYLSQICKEKPIQEVSHDCCMHLMSTPKPREGSLPLASIRHVPVNTPPIVHRFQGFSRGDWGIPPGSKSFAPNQLLHLLFNKILSPPTEFCPRKFQKFYLIFLSILGITPEHPMQPTVLGLGLGLGSQLSSGLGLGLGLGIRIRDKG